MAPEQPGVELLWDAGCQTAESPVWDGRTRTLLFADTAGGRLLGYGVDDGSREIWQLPEPLGSFGICVSGRLVVALERTVVLFERDTGRIERLTDEIDEPPRHRLNDGKVGPDGSFWVGTSQRSDDPAGAACLYKVDPKGSIERQAEGFIVSNGLAWSPDGRTMYHSDTHRGLIRAWDFDVRAGTISRPREFVKLSISTGHPDGAACDERGCYWSAGVSAGCINRFSPDGQLLDQLPTPCPRPTMVCFAPGALFVTSLRATPERDRLYFGDVEDVSGREFNVGGLFRAEVDFRGADVGRFADC